MSDLQIADLRLPLPEFNLGVGSLPPTAAVAVAEERIGRVIASREPDAVLVRGDTTRRSPAPAPPSRPGCR